jgi:hypothetical protein
LSDEVPSFAGTGFNVPLFSAVASPDMVKPAHSVKSQTTVAGKLSSQFSNFPGKRDLGQESRRKHVWNTWQNSTS